MDHLWAPWRQAYITTLKPSTPDDPCFICQGLIEQDDRKNLVVVRKRLSVLVLNRFPYNNGHLLAAPRQHKGNLGELTSEDLLAVMKTLPGMVRVPNDAMHPTGFNVRV